MAGPFPQASRFPNDEKAQAAQARALVEIDKLDKLLVSRRFPPLNQFERAAIVTYIKALDLGLLE